MIDVLTEICNRIWRTGELTYPLDSVADYYTPLKGQLAALPEPQNYQPHQSFEQSHAESDLE